MSGEAFLTLFSVAALEALLSGDNALVLAVMVRPLPAPPSAAGPCSTASWGPTSSGASPSSSPSSSSGSGGPRSWGGFTSCT